MKKLYNEFLYIPNDGKIREKVMLTRVVISVLVVIACLAAMGMSAFAYFGHTVESSSSIIQSSYFETEILIQNLDSGKPVEIEILNQKTKVATLKEGNTYSITVKKSGTASTGFCIISAENDEAAKYYTQQLGTDVAAPNENIPAITFTVTVSQTIKIKFSDSWGTSPYYADYVESGVNEEYFIIDGEAVNFKISSENP